MITYLFVLATLAILNCIVCMLYLAIGKFPIVLHRSAFWIAVYLLQNIAFLAWASFVYTALK